MYWPYNIFLNYILRQILFHTRQVLYEYILAVTLSGLIRKLVLITQQLKYICNFSEISIHFLLFKIQFFIGVDCISITY